MIEASVHAVDRYIERVAPVSRDEATRALTNKRIEAAATFGARYVRLPTGHRIVIENGIVVTLLPRDARRGYVMAKLVTT